MCTSELPSQVLAQYQRWLVTLLVQGKSSTCPDFLPAVVIFFLIPIYICNPIPSKFPKTKTRCSDECPSLRAVPNAA